MIRLYQSIYTLAFTLMVPIFLFRLFIKSTSHQQRWQERLGFVRKVTTCSPVIWIHAVSVGEVKLTQQLIEAINRMYPNTYDFVITTTTPSGAEQVRRQFPEHVIHLYHPYDVPICIDAFIKKVNPVLLLVMETELWPNLFKRCQHHKIPVALINGRLSERSFRRYKSIRLNHLGVLNNIDMICAQTEEERQRYIELGMEANGIHVTGSIKFDAQVPNTSATAYISELQKLLSHRPVWIAASTHAGEDEVMINVHQKILQQMPSAVLILAPRHPERSDDVLKLIDEAGLTVVKRSEEVMPDEEVSVVLLDSIGELFSLYHIARVAFIGGSLCNRGGQNPLEAILQNTAVISGPNTRNFNAIYQQLASEEAVTIINSEESLEKAVAQLLLNREQRDKASVNAMNFLKKNQGSTKRTLNYLEPYLQK